MASSILTVLLLALSAGWQAGGARAAAPNATLVPIPGSIAELAAPYPVKEHTVFTEDGYILTLWRIQPTSGEQPGPPVLLQHGLLDSCAGFLLLGPKALAFMLADAGGQRWPPPDLVAWSALTHAGGTMPCAATRQHACHRRAGFDVWLANSRGSTYARRHAWLDVSSPEYWAFSFDEMAKARAR